MNTVTSPFMAIVDGKSTGLSGCNGGCSGCLRADPQLADVRIDYLCALNTEHHSMFVPVRGPSK